MKLELHIPGLLAAPARLAGRLALPEASALREWCARSQTRSATAGRHGFIGDMLAVRHSPLAALAWLGATGAMPESPVFFAAPVHLQAGMNDLVLFSGPGLQVSAAECARLAADIAAFFGEEPELHCRAGQMFLRAPRTLAVKTVPLHAAQGAAVRDNLPRGADAARMHGWMNELQMFLHGHAVNRERAARGMPPLNGIWFWGEGELPNAMRREGRVVFPATLPMRGLGTLLGEVRERAGLETMLPSAGHCIIEFSDCVTALDADDIAGWESAVKRISTDVLQPVLDWLAQHRDARAVLHAGDGTARILRGGKEGRLRRMFRSRPSLPGSSMKIAVE